jgi:hypothetical protein
MLAFDYFSGAGHAWRRFAQIRLDDLLDQRGSRTDAYIAKRIARSGWGSFERRRWKYIRHLLRRGQRGSRSIGIAIDRTS